MASYSIWVLEFAYVPEFPLSGFLYGEHNAGTRRLPFAYVVAVGEDHVAMIDVGFSGADTKQRFVQLYDIAGWQPVDRVFAEIGLTPADVDTVLVTHAHYDHFGNAEAFPNATFYLQERELSKWVSAMALPSHLQAFNASIDTDDIFTALRLAAEGRLVLLDGARENVLPGISVAPAYDTHTFGSMYITIRGDDSADDCLLFAGDNVYLWDQLTGLRGDGLVRAPGLALNNWNALLLCDEMLQAVDRDPYRVIPVHEPAVPERFPSRRTQSGLAITELRLAKGAVSKVR
jgi:glyoxylase-like metal-dependent hydrolase (beta-lactamase superfamily II)